LMFNVSELSAINEVPILDEESAFASFVRLQPRSLTADLEY
jgi:hypothetical protein